MTPRKKYTCSTRRKRGRRFLRYVYNTQELIQTEQLLPIEAIDSTPRVEDLSPYQDLVEPRPIESGCFYYGPEVEG